MTIGPITHALERAESGEPGATDELWQLVYDDLKRIASGRLAKLGSGETLQATALVHEAWMRMGGTDQAAWKGRAHFFGAAAVSMRNILVDQARAKNSLRQNSGARPKDLSIEIADVGGTDPGELLALDEALTALAKDFDRPARIVMLRYFAGLTIVEIADLMEVSSRLIDREFLFARTWLRRFMEKV
ncbi:MAG: ECF-type sigma factor [Planctomycetota bacterium]